MFRMALMLPDISGALEMNCPLIMVFSSRVYIPTELLERTLADLHGAHQGVDRMQLRQERLCIGLA